MPNGDQWTDWLTVPETLTGNQATPPSPADYVGGPLLVPGLEITETETDIEHRVDKVCDDLLAGRIVPKQVDQIDAAVTATRSAHALHRAMGRS